MRLPPGNPETAASIKASLTSVVSSHIIGRALGSYGGGGPTEFRYRPLTPNCDEYWDQESDAINSLDPQEMMLWYLSRGNECRNCPTETAEQVRMGNQPLEIRVNNAAPEPIAANPGQSEKCGTAPTRRKPAGTVLAVHH